MVKCVLDGMRKFPSLVNIQEAGLEILRLVQGGTVHLDEEIHFVLLNLVILDCWEQLSVSRDFMDLLCRSVQVSNSHVSLWRPHYVALQGKVFTYVPSGDGTSQLFLSFVNFTTYICT